MLTKRLIVCLDVRNGKVTKGVKFKENVDLGDPVEMGRRYYEDGVDELVFYDIMASAEKRPIDIEMVRAVARNVFIPFSVGGGIRNLEDMRSVLLAGAEKVSLNSLAVQNPDIIGQGARAFGRQCIVLGMDAKKTGLPGLPSGYEVFVQGGRKAMGIDAIEWAKRAVSLGAGEICVNSIDADGTKDGYELDAHAPDRRSRGRPRDRLRRSRHARPSGRRLQPRQGRRRPGRLHGPLRHLLHPRHQNRSRFRRHLRPDLILFYPLRQGARRFCGFRIVNVTSVASDKSGQELTFHPTNPDQSPDNTGIFALKINSPIGRVLAFPFLRRIPELPALP